MKSLKGIFIRTFYFLLTALIIGCSKPSKQKVAQINNELKIYQDSQLTSFDSVPSRKRLIKNIGNIQNDSLKSELIHDYAYYFYKKGDNNKFRYWNKKAFSFTQEQKDTLGLARAYGSLGNFYYRQSKFDSSYYNYNISSKLYLHLKENELASNILLNMAIVQRNVRDYLGSEVGTIRSLKVLEPSENYKLLYSAYNNLGIVNNELRNYDRSLNYHKEALRFQRKLNNPVLEATSLNNIGVVYKNKKDYLKAIQYFSQALSTDNLRMKNPRLYAMLLDNLAYSKLKSSGKEGGSFLLEKSLRIRDSIDHASGIAINKIHFAQYYLHAKDTSKAIEYLKEAKELSAGTDNYRDLLESLELLSKIEQKNSTEHLRSYIDISDSLIQKEREIRNKFARIRYETDQFIDENQELTEERKWVFAGTFLIVLFLGLLYIIRIQRINNKRLVLERKQQLANEEIYNLMIASQQKIEEGKNREKKRISEELHDGILSKFFGIRLNLEILNEKNDDGSLIKRENYIKELKQIELEIRNVSHELSADSFTDEISFKRILEDLVEDQLKLDRYKIELNIDDRLNWEDIDAKSKVHLYRILQEALHNINKYASASKVTITFKILGERVMLCIKDNGCGFDLENVKEGIGLKNMKSRVEELNGQIFIKSNKSGTSIIIEFQY